MRLRKSGMSVLSGQRGVQIVVSQAQGRWREKARRMGVDMKRRVRPFPADPLLPNSGWQSLKLLIAADEEHISPWRSLWLRVAGWLFRKAY